MLEATAHMFVRTVHTFHAPPLSRGNSERGKRSPRSCPVPPYVLGLSCRLWKGGGLEHYRLGGPDTQSDLACLVCSAS